jgi:serine/threonine protein kinase
MERARRKVVLDAIAAAKVQGLNPIGGCRVDGDRIEVREAYVEGFTLGAAIEAVRRHMSVNVALAIAYDIVRALTQLHKLRPAGASAATVIHGRLELDQVLISSLGETLLLGIDGVEGDAQRDVDSVMLIVQDLLATRAASAQGGALLERLAQLQFTTAQQLEGAVRLYLDRQDPAELLARRARFTSSVLAELGGAFSVEDSLPELEAAKLEPVRDDEDSTVLEPVPSILLRADTNESAPTGILGEADPWDEADSARPNTVDSVPEAAWKSLEPWANQQAPWGEQESMNPWKVDATLDHLEDPTHDEASLPPDPDPEPEEATDASSEALDEVRAALLASAAVPPDRPKKAHVMVGDYRIVASIGRGGMGEIYLARRFVDGAPGALVALKVLSLTDVGDETALDMFMDEAAIMAQIDHPNVLEIVDFGRSQGRYFLATEYLEGRPLVRVMIEAYAKEKGLDYATIAAIGADAAYGLFAAHTARSPEGKPLNVVHRDVSPQNIFVTYNGVAKVIDFGVARATERVSKTAVGLVKGKAAYMSPEQAEGASVDARSDVFSLGICLWEMSAGKRLFKRENDFDTLLAVQTADVEPPSRVRGMPDPVFDQIVLDALRRDRDARTQTARDLAAQLVDYVSTKAKGERSGRMMDLMMRLFADVAKQEHKLIRSLEADTATGAEVDALKRVSGVLARIEGKRADLVALDDFGTSPTADLPSKAPGVLEAVRRLNAERVGPESQPRSAPIRPESVTPVVEIDAAPTRRLTPTPSPSNDPSVLASAEGELSGVAIEIDDSDFENVGEPSKPGVKLELHREPPSRADTGPISGQGVVPIIHDGKDRVPTTVLEGRRPWVKVAAGIGSLAVVALGAAALLRSEEDERKPPSVADPVDLRSVAAPPPVDEKPPPAIEPIVFRLREPRTATVSRLAEVETSTPTFERMKKDLEAKGLKLEASEGTLLAPDGAGGSVILDGRGAITRLTVGRTKGFLIASGSELMTSVTWVGSIDGGEWSARPLTINDCRATHRIFESGIGVRYGGEEIVLPHGGGKLRDVSLHPPPLADRLEVAPLGVSFGRRDEERSAVHCKVGWWGKRVVLRRLPIGKYTLHWIGEGVSQSARLEVLADRVAGGDAVGTSSAAR